MSAKPITVQILDKEYRIACPEGQEEALRESASFLNKRILEVRETGKVIGPDRITVMAALNLAHEYLSERTEYQSYTNSIDQRVRSLHERIDSAIRSNNQLEF